MRIVLLGLMIAFLSALLLLGAGPGYRSDIWTLRTAFTLIRWAAYGGIAAAALSVVGLALAGRGRGKALLPGLLGLIIAVTCVVIPWRWQGRARSVPPIHDITTDTEEPPEFIAVLPLRAGAPNPSAYGGPEIAAQQRTAYPDVQPLLLEAEPGVVFQRALDEARALAWDIVAADTATGRIEATATTFWFGFKDDVVVRLTPTDTGTVVDVRSVSRVGRSDVGTNAARIREFLERLRR